MDILFVSFVSFLLRVCSAFDAPRDLLVYRALQIDIQGVQQGCRVPTMNLESIRFDPTLDKSAYNRKCVVVTLDEIGQFIADHHYDYNAFEPVQGNAGGFLIVIPPSLVFPPKKTQVLSDWEQLTMFNYIKIPIYFVEESPDMAQLIEELDSDLIRSMTTTFPFDFSSKVHQLSVPTAPVALKDPEVVVIESRFLVSDEVPTIIISSYYDAYGIAPGLAFGADSNASGTVAAIQLMRLLSKLFNGSRRKAKVNLINLLSGGGTLNYFGTKKWLEHLDHKLDNHLSNVAFVMSLESLTQSDNMLFVHATRSPRDVSLGSRFISELQNRTSAAITTRGINDDGTLAWEHELFSSRRLPSFTLSTLSNHQTSIFDSCEKLNLDVLNQRINDIFYSLQVVMFGRIEIKNDASILSTQTLLDKLCSTPRSQQLLSSSSSHLVNDLESIMRKTSPSVTIHRFKPDKKEPEFTFYEPSKMKMTIYTSKPVIIDVLLFGCILVYFGLFYLVVNNIHTLTGFIWKSEKREKHVKSR